MSNITYYQRNVNQNHNNVLSHTGQNGQHQTINAGEGVENSMEIPLNWCFQIVVLEKTLESPLDCKELKPVNPKGNQPWIYIERTDAEVEAPVLWPPDVKSQLTGKDPDTGKDWKEKEKGVAEDEMVR